MFPTLKHTTGPILSDLMFYQINGKMHSTLNCAELNALTKRVDECADKIEQIRRDPCTIALETDKQIANLFEEMFGEE